MRFRNVIEKHLLISHSRYRKLCELDKEFSGCLQVYLALMYCANSSDIADMMPLIPFGKDVVDKVIALLAAEKIVEVIPHSCGNETVILLDSTSNGNGGSKEVSVDKYKFGPFSKVKHREEVTPLWNYYVSRVKDIFGDVDPASSRQYLKKLDEIVGLLDNKKKRLFDDDIIKKGMDYQMDELKVAHLNFLKGHLMDELLRKRKETKSHESIPKGLLYNKTGQIMQLLLPSVMINDFILIDILGKECYDTVTGQMKVITQNDLDDFVNMFGASSKMQFIFADIRSAHGDWEEVFNQYSIKYLT